MINAQSITSFLYDKVCDLTNYKALSSHHLQE